MPDCLYTYTDPDGKEHRFDTVEDLHAYLLSDAVNPEDVSKAKAPVSAFDGEPLSIHHAGLTELATKLGLPEPERMEYKPPEWYRQRGDKLLAGGANPYEVNNSNNRLDDRISIAGAHLNELHKQADEIARTHPDGVESQEYKDAALKMNAYANDVMKKLGSEAHASMVALQTPVDWTSFSSVKDRVEKQTKKPLTEKQKEKVKTYTDAIKKVKDELSRLNKELVETTDRDMKERNDEPKKTYSERAKSVADTFRKLKTKPFVFKDENGKEIPIKIAGLDWNELVELGAKAIEKTGEIADGVAEIIDKIKDTDWYVRLSTNDQKKLQDQLHQHYESVRELTPEEKLLKRKEKLKADLEAGKVEQKAVRPDYHFTEEQQRESDRLDEEIAALRERMGLNKSKAEKPQTDTEKVLTDEQRIKKFQEQFVDKVGDEFTANEARAVWDYMKKSYLDNGMEIKDAIAHVANDTGLTWSQVSKAITSKKTQGMSDAMWNKQAKYRRMQQAAEDWALNQDKTAFGVFWRNLSGIFRGTAVFGHGGIFIGTHAGMTLFNPSQWKYVIPAFIRAYKFAYGNNAAYERSMEELKSNRNYVKAMRAGLKNNPERMNVEDFQKSQIYLEKFFGKVGVKIGQAGEKGFNAIKILRQDLFNYHYDRLSDAEKNDEDVLANIARIVNNATGATNLNLPKWVNETSFAGGMEAARWGKLTRNPAKATTVALKALIAPETASAADRVFAKVWARRVGEQLGTYVGMLGVNAAIQAMVNPGNPVNLFNPDEKDWLKFKFGDTTIDPTSGMLGILNFIKGVGEIPLKTKKERKGDTVAESLGKQGIGYGRGKLAPLYSTMFDLYSKTDYYGNTFPYNPDKPQKGSHRLSWLEYGWEKMPIPIAEAAHITYQAAHEHGVSAAQLGLIGDGLIHGAISGGTGFRIGEYEGKKQSTAPPVQSDLNEVIMPDTSPAGVIMPEQQ